MDTQQALTQALQAIPERTPALNLYQRYYAGDHRCLWDHGKYQAVFAQAMRTYRLNLCELVIDSLAARLRVTGWTMDDDHADQEAENLWRANDLDTSHGDLIHDTLLFGAGHLAVWQDPTGEVRVTAIPTREMWWDEQRDVAVRAWICPDTDIPRVTVYHPDRTERFAAPQKTDGPAAVPTDPKKLRPLTVGDVPEGADANPVVPNQWGVIPVTHFINPKGSELASAIPIQDAVNKQVVDAMFAGEREALPNRWQSGVEPALDPDGREKPMNMRPGEWLTLTPPDARAGQFPSIDITPLRGVADSSILDIARVKGVPLHHLAPTGQWPTGAALKTAESRQKAMADKRVLAWSGALRRMMRLALRMRGVDGVAEPVWASTETPSSEVELLEAARLKLTIGIPREVVWRELGYGEDEITRMRELADEEARNDEHLAARAFNAGAMG